MMHPFFSRRTLRSPQRGVAVAALAAGLLMPGFTLHAQVTGSTTTTTDAQGQKQTNVTLSTTTGRKKKKTPKSERVTQSKDTRRELKRESKETTRVKQDEQLPDKQLFDKAMKQEKSGHFDVARLDLQTLLNTYPDSQYLMQAKLAIANSWFQEGGSAALAQAEQEYSDFITFFPNAPEAAEAQMRIGDIHFKQMDVPDRDYTQATKAEAAYRTMLKQYPDAPAKVLVEAKQKLRDVQEVLAQREANIGAFYSTHENWPAAIARYETVVHTYPQYSHMDDVLIGIGDSYEAEANLVRGRTTCAKGVMVPCLPEGAKSKLEQDFDAKAADAYRAVVLKHSAAPHAEDAKERLAAMHLPIPTPTPEEVAASEKLEGSRAQYTMRKRLELLVMHKPDTVTAAQTGEPPLDDAPATVAPTVVKDIEQDYVAALNPKAAAAEAKAETAKTPAEATANAPAPGAAIAAPPAGATAPTLEDVPTAPKAVDAAGSVSEVAPASGSEATPSTGIGSEIISTGGGSAPPSNLPAATGKPDPNYGLGTVAPANSTPLPPVEKPAEAPDQVNEVAGKPQPVTPVTTNTNSKKHKAPAYEKDDESSSKHKPKKGASKLNPF